MRQLLSMVVLGCLLFGGFLYVVGRITKPIERQLNSHQTLYILTEEHVEEAEESIKHYITAVENDIKININQNNNYKSPRQCKVGKNPRFCKISYREYIYVGIVDHYPSEGVIKFDTKGNVVGGNMKIYRFSFQINPDGTLTRK